MTHGTPSIRRLIERLMFAGVVASDWSRMESSGFPGRIQVTEGIYERLHTTYDFEARGEVEVKGKGRLPTYLLTRRHADLT